MTRSEHDNLWNIEQRVPNITARMRLPESEWTTPITDRSPRPERRGMKVIATALAAIVAAILALPGVMQDAHVASITGEQAR